MNMKKPTLDLIAMECGVTKGLVSRALAGKNNVSDTMRERKKLLEDNADAFIITPGGIGTFDEFFEILSLKQLSRLNKPIVIYNSLGYYNPLIEMLNAAIKGNFMSAKNLELFKTTESIDEVFDYIENYQPTDLIDLTELKDVKYNVEQEM